MTSVDENYLTILQEMSDSLKRIADAVEKPAKPEAEPEPAPAE